MYSKKDVGQIDVLPNLAMGRIREGDPCYIPIHVEN
jgi:hypothetical protein